MLRHRLTAAFLVITALLPPALALAAARGEFPEPRRLSLTEQFPWLTDFVALFLGLGIIALLVYLARPSRSASGFTIHVDEEDISFSGKFPHHMQQTVIDFLRMDCPIAGSYQIRGHWETGDTNPMLIIIVRGENARPLEQRIRNFLKLNLKPPRTGE